VIARDTSVAPLSVSAGSMATITVRNDLGNDFHDM
jgi:hypothetical protein